MVNNVCAGDNITKNYKQRRPPDEVQLKREGEILKNQRKLETQTTTKTEVAVGIEGSLLLIKKTADKQTPIDMIQSEVCAGGRDATPAKSESSPFNRSSSALGGLRSI